MMPGQRSERWAFFVVKRLPHVQVPARFLGDTRVRLRVYPDTDLGLVLNRREPAVVARFCELVDADSTVLDVGAHIGLYALLAAERGATTAGFEPHPANARRFRRHRRVNGHSAATLRIEEAAAADTAGTATLAQNNDDTRHTLAADGDLEVPRVRLDDYCVTYGLEPTLVKVDVEGVAGTVLDGAPDIVDAGTQWLIEIHDDDERARVETVLDGYGLEPMGDKHILATP